MENLKQLSSWPASAKILVTGFLVSLLIGYAVAFLMIHNRTQFGMDQTIRYYRGDDVAQPGAHMDEMSIHLPKPYSEILAVSHVHMFSQPLLVLAVGVLFFFCSVGEGTKTLAYLASMLGLLLSNLAPWLLRYGGEEFVFIYPFSNFLMMGGLVLMTCRILYELWGHDNCSAHPGP